MSVIRLDKIHIDALISAGMSNDYAHSASDLDVLTFQHKGIQYKLDTFGAHEVGSALQHANNRAANTRYTEHEPCEPYTLNRLNVEALPPVVILRLIAGYRYQAIEAPDWPDSLASSYLDCLERAAIKALPGYNEAPFALDPAGYGDLLLQAGAPRGRAS